MTRTLHVTIAPTDRSDLEDRLAAIDAGEDVDPGAPTLSIEDLETFGRVFRATNLELLAAIVDHEVGFPECSANDWTTSSRYPSWDLVGSAPNVA